MPKYLFAILNPFSQYEKSTQNLTKTTKIHHAKEVPVVQWLSSQGMDTATRVQILDLTDCISHSTNTLGKGMNPKYSPSSYG